MRWLYDANFVIRVVGRYENPEGQIGSNVVGIICPLIRKGLTEPPNSGWAAHRLVASLYPESYFLVHSISWQNLANFVPRPIKALSHAIWKWLRPFCFILKEPASLNFFDNVCHMTSWPRNGLLKSFRDLWAKSLYISHAVSNFYRTGIEIWAGFGPIGSTEKKGSGPIMSNFWGCFFHVFRGQIFFF